MTEQVQETGKRWAKAARDIARIALSMSADLLAAFPTWVAAAVAGGVGVVLGQIAGRR